MDIVAKAGLIVFVLGTTAVGKSKLSLKLAKSFNG